MSFPPGTEMFQFPGFASQPYLIQIGIPLRVGFPIRICPDQSLFAAPRTFSQRTTSFIASQRQGIHRTPFWHLIVLIIHARRINPSSLKDQRKTDRTIKDQFFTQDASIHAVRQWS
jgi:hypothetical protein